MVYVLERVFDKELSEKTFERMIHDLEKRTKRHGEPICFRKEKTWKYLKRISSYRGMMYKHGGISKLNMFGKFGQILQFLKHSPKFMIQKN